MADRTEEAVRKKALASEYAEKLSKRREKVRNSLTPEQYRFFGRLENVTLTPVYAEFERAMKKPGTVPSEYLSAKMGWLFHSAIPGKEKEVVLYFADRLTEYPYSNSYVRRSFRSGENAAYVSKLVDLIRSYDRVVADPVGAPLAKILNRELPEDAQAYFEEYTWNGCGYTEWQVAYALDHREERVEDAVRRILTEENGSGMMTNALIRGVLISHRGDFHVLLGKLLLAAKLQEGLRQAICENADCGTREGFLSLLKVIDENGLIRFSSVKRAVGTWLGLMAGETRDLERVSEKSVRLIAECLENKKRREECLASEDAMELYIALWSYGFDDIGEAEKKISAISEHGTEHQLLVSGYFAANLDQPYFAHRIAKTVLARRGESEKVLAVWLPSFLSTRRWMLWNAYRTGQPFDHTAWFESKAEVCEWYERFKETFSAFSGKEKTFSPCVFPWYEAKLSKSNFAELLCVLAALTEDKDVIDEACGYLKDCAPDCRQTCFCLLLRHPETGTQRKAVLAGLADRETSTRKSAFEIASEMKPTEEELRSVEELLRFKGADIRKNVIELLLKQGKKPLTACISRLLGSEKEEMRLAGLDMLMQTGKDPERSGLAASFAAVLKSRANAPDLTEKEKILLKTLVPEEEEPKDAALFTEGDRYVPTSFDEEYISLCVKSFAEYFPDSSLPALLAGKKNGGLFGRLLSAISDGPVCKTAMEADADLKTLSAYIDEHRNDSFRSFNGEMLVGAVQYQHQFTDTDGGLPLSGTWQTWFRENGITNARLLRAAIRLFSFKKKTVYAQKCAPSVRNLYGAGFETGTEYPYSEVMAGILCHFLGSLPKEECSRLASAIAVWFLKCVPDDMIIVPAPAGIRILNLPDKAHLIACDPISIVFRWMKCENCEELRSVFPLAVAVTERCADAYRKLPKEKTPLGTAYAYAGGRTVRTLLCPYEGGLFCKGNPLAGPDAYLFAAYRGIITEAQLYAFLLDPENVKGSLGTVTAVASSYYENGRLIAKHGTDYRVYHRERWVKQFLGEDGEPDEETEKLIAFVVGVYEKLIPVILSSELSRGDSEGEYSSAIREIARVYGADYFARILSALGNDTIDRSGYQGWSSGNGRRGTLSYLLSVCIPAEGDTAETLRAALNGRKITKKRLIEASLYSPEWIPIVGQYLEIPSYESVCYYFMAHMNEKFDDKRKAMIAKYTPLTEDELNLGAFDRNWFRSAFDAIGEKDFNFIYDAAKYITDGARHSRARKYADAALGRTDVAETEKAVSEKRNKDLLMAYALIPLSDEDDICRRYLFIQKFRKESRQFGAQRSANEGKAAETALLNLAINAGYSDAMRLTLRMETKVIDDERALLEEQTVDGVSFRIVTDESGKASLLVVRDGKTLKSVPEKLKKNETVLAMTAFAKTMTEQYRRSRQMFERAMEDGTVFSFGELKALSAHPVVWPMLKTLVFVSGEAVGFLSEEGLTGIGEKTVLTEDAEARIAHPFDLYQKGCWRDFQKFLYDERITQPFRQVFRELYIKTPEEAEMLHSLRYAGNQIQPAKTAAVLKSRRWVADVENGLQKVYYKENIIAQIYALADWFSPADIEAPTLEWVCFTDRRTWKELKISEIPDIVFSEVMRDVDLAVSVAHAGGVDPEASHSTVEMRAAILSFVLPLFRIGNVRIDGSHAIIEGKRAEYSVHLGSGVVHQIGGAMIPVLPVHSQHRGKVFLPFTDDDPKTAEIVSKVLLFAEDDKIKDPSILSAISPRG